MSNKIYYPQDLASENKQLDPLAEKIFNNTCIRLTIVDCPGQQSATQITPQALRKSDAAFLCFDVCDRHGFEDVQKWFDLVKNHSPESLCVLVGCKIDKDFARVVDKAEASAWASSKGLPYFETSAKDNSNVESTFKFVTVNLRQRWYGEEKVKIANNQQHQDQTNRNNGRVRPGVDLNNNNKSQKSESGGCCK